MSTRKYDIVVSPDFDTTREPAAKIVVANMTAATFCDSMACGHSSSRTSGPPPTVPSCGW